MSGSGSPSRPLNSGENTHNAPASICAGTSQPPSPLSHGGVIPPPEHSWYVGVLQTMVLGQSASVLHGALMQYLDS